MAAYLILSDIHSNLEALEAVLAAVDGEWDRLLVLGDLVGYGGDPNAVVDRIRALGPAAVIRGNHDKAASGIDDASNFNQIARYAAIWTAEVLSDDNREYLRALPPGPVTIDERLEICHGSPFDEDHYIFDADDAQRALEASDRQLCLFGHTHLPVIFKTEDGALQGYVPDGEAPVSLVLRDGVRYAVNAGSVGQPRDGDPRAAYALYTPETLKLELRRVAYAVDAAQRRIVVAGLPASLANRLAVGR
jgi:diadenosine tetraphosphatase ApaH/serine/threonine PP2A family protein phosphatase